MAVVNRVATRPGMLIWGSGLSSGQGEAAVATVVVAAASSASAVMSMRGGLARVSWRRLVSLKCAGWLPQDGVSSDGGPLSIFFERDPLWRLGITHSILAGHRQLARLYPASTRHWTFCGVGLLLEDGQRPAPAGQLACDRGIGYRGGAFGAGIKPTPAGM